MSTENSNTGRQPKPCPSGDTDCTADCGRCKGTGTSPPTWSGRGATCPACGHPDSEHRAGKYTGGCVHSWLGLHKREFCTCTRENEAGRAEGRRAAALWNAYLGREPESPPARETS